MCRGQTARSGKVEKLGHEIQGGGKSLVSSLTFSGYPLTVVHDHGLREVQSCMLHQPSRVTLCQTIQFWPSSKGTATAVLKAVQLV